MTDLIERIVNAQITHSIDRYITDNLESLTVDELEVSNFSCLEQLTQDMVLKFPNLPWNYSTKHFSTTMSLEFIDNHIHFNWNWSIVSLNPNLTLEFVSKHRDKNWNWIYIAAGPKFTVCELEEYIHISKILLGTIYRDDLTSDFCNKYLLDIHPNDICSKTRSPKALCESKYEIDWVILSYNFFLEEDIIKDNLDKPWSWNVLSFCCKFEIISNNPNFPWHWNVISYRPELDKNLVLKYIDKPWNWKNVVVHVHDIDSEFITKIFHTDWTWSNIIDSRNISDQIICSFPHVSWDWSGSISHMKDLTMKIINKFPDKPWNLFRICPNPRFNPNDLCEIFFERNSEVLPELLSNNPRLTPETILKYPSNNWVPSEIINHNNNLRAFSKYPQFKFETSSGSYPYIRLKVYDNDCTIYFDNKFDKYLDLDVFDLANLGTGIFEKSKSNICWKVCTKTDMTTRIRKELIEHVYRPIQVEMHLNKYNYLLE